MRRALSYSNRLVSKTLTLLSPHGPRGPAPTILRLQARRALTSSRPDPFARRPNKKCDPYGQDGKPLSLEDAEQLLETVSDEWNLVGESAITREFVHADFLAGSSFLTHIAAVAQMNDHFPSLALQRQLDSKKKAWRVVSSVTCSTKVLQGLSHHDFFLATLIDVEIERPNVKSLLVRVPADDEKER